MEFFLTVFTHRSVSDWTFRRDQKAIFVKSPYSGSVPHLLHRWLSPLVLPTHYRRNTPCLTFHWSRNTQSCAVSADCRHPRVRGVQCFHIEFFVKPPQRSAPLSPTSTTCQSRRAPSPTTGRLRLLPLFSRIGEKQKTHPTIDQSHFSLRWEKSLIISKAKPFVDTWSTGTFLQNTSSASFLNARLLNNSYTLPTAGWQHWMTAKESWLLSWTLTKHSTVCGTLVYYSS